jgi:glutathione synthase/RimK-type ligase-like ATP-grasp enzyme
VSNSLDAHSDDVERELNHRGFETFRVNTDRFSSDCVRLVFKGDVKDSNIIVNGKTCQISDIMSVWYRRPEQLETNVIDPYQKAFAEKELGELLRQFYQFPSQALWVSRIEALEKARRKLPQLLLAKKLGMSIPRTLVSNSPEEIRLFFMECSEKMIYKTLHSPVIRLGEGNELWGIPTTMMTSEHMEAINSIDKTGGIFQEYIEKDYEIRVTIIGNDIFAAKVDSQKVDSAKVDWREAVALGQVEVKPYCLPEKISGRCKLLAKSYGLNFGAIDLIRSVSGDYVFLELNCNGQWLWIEEVTGQPMLDSMVKLLTLNQRKGGEMNG